MNGWLAAGPLPLVSHLSLPKALVYSMPWDFFDLPAPHCPSTVCRCQHWLARYYEGGLWGGTVLALCINLATARCLHLVRMHFSSTFLPISMPAGNSLAIAGCMLSCAVADCPAAAQPGWQPATWPIFFLPFPPSVAQLSPMGHIFSYLLAARPAYCLEPFCPQLRPTARTGPAYIVMSATRV